MVTFAHRFQHTVATVDVGYGAGFETPLWIVGSSPFDDAQTEDDGYIVHLEAPRFVARWFVGDKPEKRIDTLSGLTFHDPDLDITLCEVVWHDEPTTDVSPWLCEAAAVIAHQLDTVYSIEEEDDPFY